MDSDDSHSYSSSLSSSNESSDLIASDDCKDAQPYLFEPYDSDASLGTERVREVDNRTIAEH